MISLSVVITIIGIVQALFLLGLIVPRLNKNEPITYAALLLLIFVIDFSMYLLINIRLSENGYFLLGLGETTLFLYGPVVYLYSKSLLGINKGSKAEYSELIHFVPAVIVYILLSPFLFRETTFSGLNSLRENLPFLVSVYTAEELVFDFLLWYLHVLIYFSISLKLLINQKKKKNDPESSSHIKWIKSLLLGYFLFAFINASGILLDPYFDFRFTSYKVLNAFLAFHVFVISYIGFKNQSILFTPINKLRYSKSTLSDDKKKEYLATILNYFEHSQPYLDQDLTLKKVATHLDILQNHVSQVINEELGKRFSEFVNSYRIQLAKKHLADPAKNMLTIEGIASEVGFKSKSSFNTAFKRETGVTPSSFKKNLNSKENSI